MCKKCFIKWKTLIWKSDFFFYSFHWQKHNYHKLIFCIQVAQEITIILLTHMQWYLCIYLGSSVMYFKIHLFSFFWWPITLQDWKIYECRYAKLVKMSLSITSLTTKKCLNIWFSLLKPAWQSYEKGFTLLLLLNK